MNQSQPWQSPAKLNLFLHIIGRRDDGYHQLQTIFQLIDYGDSLHFEVREDGELELSCNDPTLKGQDNLVYKAARALQQQSGCGKGAMIRLEKKIPMGAGLGGGSSNAATALVALNSLWQLGYSNAELEKVGVKLGADVPVFVRGVSAWAEGVGEKLQPISLPQRWFVVLNPAIHVSTAELFNDRQLTRDCTPITIRAFHEGAPTQNVFEAVVCERYAEVLLALNTLRKVAAICGLKAESSRVSGTDAEGVGYLEPRMTGTGSSVFLACESETLAHNVLSGLYEWYRPGSTKDEASTSFFSVTQDKSVVTGFVAKGMEQSPLFAAGNTGSRF